MPVEIASVLLATALGVCLGWGRRTAVNEVVSARLTTGLESITGELVLIRQEMREDRKESSLANRQLFERITEVERGVIDRISGVEARVSVLEGDR
jgi:hypothetical protein